MIAAFHFTDRRKILMNSPKSGVETRGRTGASLAGGPPSGRPLGAFVCFLFLPHLRFHLCVVDVKRCKLDFLFHYF